MAVELQVCRNDLQNTRILATESVRSADASSRRAGTAWSSSSSACSRRARQRKRPGASSAAATRRNLLVPVRFAFGSTQVAIPDAEAARVVEEARVGAAGPAARAHRRHDRIAGRKPHRPRARRGGRGVAGAGRASIAHASAPPSSRSATTRPTTAPRRPRLNRRVEIEIYRARRSRGRRTPRAVHARARARTDANPPNGGTMDDTPVPQRRQGRHRRAGQPRGGRQGSRSRRRRPRWPRASSCATRSPR